MSEFQAFLTLGFEHISDINGYDHIVFLIALCAVYSPSSWKKVLWLATAFTVGHSITLALSVLDIVTLPSKFIEFLIPVTILITAIYNTYYPYEPDNTKRQYGMAIGFGLIHGMGFSNYLKALLGEGESVWMPLMAFNLGLEMGQLLIVTIIVLGAGLFTKFFQRHIRDWTIFLSGAAAGIALLLIRERWLF